MVTVNFPYPIAVALNTPCVRQAVESLQASGVNYEVFSDVSVEPTDASWLKAMEWARKNNFSHFLACV